jgi:general secretion pathway protein K
MSRRIASKITLGNRQSGMAVVSAMLLAALVVFVAISMMYEQQRYINRLENHLSATQARWMSEASIHWSRAILAEDAKAGEVDHLKENWAIRLPATSFEGGTISGFITDQQQYCNLNNLMQGENVDLFKQLFASIGTNTIVVDTLKDWIDADNDITYPYGAESDYYLARPIPFRAGNQPLTEVGNLSRVLGFSDGSIAKLRHYCNVLPEPTPVNLNTASPELLRLMAPELSQFDLETIVAARNLHPFENNSDVTKLLEQSKLVLSSSRFSVGSHYFMVTSQTQFGKSTMRTEALLKRDGGGWPQLIWKRYR